MPVRITPTSPRLLAVLLFGALFNAGCGTNPQTYLNRGNKYFDSGKFDDAAIQYQKALQKDPKLGLARYRLGLVYLKRNQPILALREFQRAADLLPGNSELTNHLGQLSLSIYNIDPQKPKQLHDEAAKAADRLYADHPEGFEANLLKGALALTDGQPADAIKFLQKAVELKPEDHDARLGLARALTQNNQPDAGIAMAQALVEKDKTFGAAYDFLFEQYELAGKKTEAENILKQKAANNPKQSAPLLELARFYAVAQNAPAVNATIDRLVSDKTDFPEGQLMAGDFFTQVGRPQEALQHYRDGLNAKPKDDLAYRRRLARLLAAERKWPEALEQVDAILKEKSDDPDAKLNRALLWLNEGKPQNLDPAIAELKAEAAKRPKDSALHFELGNALIRKGDQDGARREWLSAAQQNKNYLPARLALVEMDLSQGKGQDALQMAQQMMDVAPKDPQVRLWYATSLTAAGRFPDARSELDRLVQQYPKSTQVQFRRGALALAEHKFKEAETVFHNLQATNAADPKVIAGLAEAYQGENEHDKAIALLQGEIQRSPDAFVLRQILGELAGATGNYDLAIEQYKQVAQKTPNSLPVQLALAAAYSAKGNTSEAIPVLQKAIEIDPKSAQANLQLARVYVAQGKFNEAKAKYRRTVDLDPNNSAALNDLAYLMAESGENLDEALAFANRGMHSVTDPSVKKSLSDTLGWIYLKKNNYDSALQIFQTLVKTDPNNATYHYHLASTLYQKGDKKQARTELEAALASKPGSADEPKIRELLTKL
jgi:tetratricopeptide (TPR) repeat protein